MSIVDLFESSIHRNNMAHFSAIVNLAAVDGQINEFENVLIQRFVKKLDITKDEYNQVIENPKKYPVIPQSKKDDRLERLLDLFKIIFSDHNIDKEEYDLILRYAMQLGCSEQTAKTVIAKSVKLFSAKIDFEDYKKILNII